jgi:DNA-directed RNA polymerase specialized sigma24 family protein
MPDRKERLRKLAPGAPDALLAELAALPAAQVDQVASFARQARRDALADDRARRRQRREDARKYRHHDEAELNARDLRVLAAAGRRAASDPEALAGLAAAARQIQDCVSIAVAGLRSRGLSDTEIGAVLGVTKQAVQSRYRRAEPRPAGPAGPDPAQDTGPAGLSLPPASRLVERVFELVPACLALFTGDPAREGLPVQIRPVRR